MKNGFLVSNLKGWEDTTISHPSLLNPFTVKF
jgi:hypothetical protein